MGHRKQLTSFAPVVPHHLIRTPRTRQYQADLPHRPSAEHIRPASHRSFRLPPRPPCRRAGRDDTASKQRQHLITLSRSPQPHLIRHHPHRPAWGRATARQPEQQDAAHGIDTDSKQVRRDARHHRLPVPRSEQARSDNETRWGRDRRHRQHRQPQRSQASKQLTAAAPPYRQDKRYEKRADIQPATTRRVSETRHGAR